MSIKNDINEYWQMLVAAATAIGGALRWWTLRKKRKKQSSQLLLEELENLKKKVILQVAAEVKAATELAEMRKILDELRLHCPDCYMAVMNKLENDADLPR